MKKRKIVLKRNLARPLLMFFHRIQSRKTLKEEIREDLEINYTQKLFSKSEGAPHKGFLKVYVVILTTLKGFAIFLRYWWRPLFGTEIIALVHKPSKSGSFIYLLCFNCKRSIFRSIAGRSMSIVTTMASDSKLHTRGREPPFFGCLGVCLSLDNANSLNTAYESLISDLFTKYRVARTRNIYKASDLREKLHLSNTTRFIKVLEKFYTSILDIKDLSIVISYTTFNTQKLPTVNYYGRSRTPTKVVSTVDFIKNLSNCYNYISAWKVQKVLSLKNCNIFLDSFEGEITNSWNELVRNHNIKICVKGDQCNPLIASADVITRFFDEILASKLLRLDGEGFEELFREYGKDGVFLYYIGQSDLTDIVPAVDKPIPIYKYLQQPSVFLLPEGIIKKEKDWFEKSATYDKVLNFASEIGGGLKRIKIEDDHNYIMHNPTSYLIYQGDKGLSVAEYIKKLYPIKIMGLDDINSTSETG